MLTFSFSDPIYSVAVYIEKDLLGLTLALGVLPQGIGPVS